MPGLPHLRRCSCHAAVRCSSRVRVRLLPQILDSLLSQVEARNDLAMGQRERPRQSYGESSRRQVADTEEGVGLEPINGGGGYELQSLRHAYQTAHLQHMLR